MAEAGSIKAEVLVRFPGREPEVVGTVDIPVVAVPADGVAAASPAVPVDLAEYGRALKRLGPTAQAFADAAAGLGDRG